MHQIHEVKLMLTGRVTIFVQLVIVVHEDISCRHIHTGKTEEFIQARPNRQNVGAHRSGISIQTCYDNIKCRQTYSAHTGIVMQA